ncbi:MAG: site-specific DNA-methyltransferase [Bacillota bacterium]|nr:MAG: site-specific DNA-methyltransferase [Bacillota bacterium]
MEKKKSSRNKTIDFTEEEGRRYLERVLPVERLTGEERDVTICGDLFAAAARLKRESVDLIVADPPYNLDKDFHGSRFEKESDEAYAAYTRRWLDAVLPLLKADGSLYVCCDWESSLVIGNVLKEKLRVKNRITWQREKGRGAMRNWKNGMEDIWFAVKSEKYTFHLDAVKVKKKVIAPYRENGAPKDWTESADGRFRLTCPSNFWDDISIPYWSMPENTAHPTQKPEKLVAKLILASSAEGGVVFDPFLGSGTTSVTAKKLGRHYIGVEKNPLYCAWAEQRLERAETDKTIQGFKNGVFLERNGR